VSVVVRSRELLRDSAQSSERWEMAVHPNAEQIAPHVTYDVLRFYEDARNLQRRREVIGVGTIVSSGPQLQGGVSAPQAQNHPGDQPDVNRSLESFLLHARKLYDLFFVPPRKSAPDVFFEHFLDAGHGWSPDPNQLCPYLHGQRERLNRSIQHLSYDRIGYEPHKEWNVSTIVAEVTALWDEFFRRLPPARRQWFVYDGRLAQGGPISPNLSAKTAP
jgi:hypothetical protein